MSTKNGSGHLLVDSVSHYYNHLTPQEVYALRDVNLELAPGDFCVVVGANGSGKSTLVKLIAGRILKPDKGKICLDDLNIVGKPEHYRTRWLSYVMQNPLDGTARDMTVAENLALAHLRSIGKASLRSGISKAQREKFKKLLARIGLDDRLEQPVATLSGGERQMLTIYMNSFGPPSLMLLDEPVSALDPSYSKKCLELIVSLNSDKAITVLMVTHNIKQALEFGNKLIALRNGRIVAEYHGDEKTRLGVEDIVNLLQ